MHANPTDEIKTTGVAAKINAAHERCERSMKDGLRHAIEAGQLLIEAKAGLKHGTWGAWLAANVTVSTRMAQKYMSVAKAFGELPDANTPRVADLSFREALRITTKAAKEVAALPDDVSERLCELPDSSFRDLRATKHKINAEIAREQCDRNNRAVAEQAIRVELPRPWVRRQDREALRDHVAREAFPGMVARLDASNAERDELLRRLEAVDAENDALRRDLGNAVADEMVTRYGNVPDRTCISIVPTGVKLLNTFEVDAGLFCKLRDDPEDEISKEQAIAAAGFCPLCGVRLSDATAEQCEDDPSQIYSMCRWCRAHRGETHCYECARPLSGSQEDTWCDQCNADAGRNQRNRAGG